MLSQAQHPLSAPLALPGALPQVVKSSTALPMGFFGAPQAPRGSAWHTGQQGSNPNQQPELQPSVPVSHGDGISVPHTLHTAATENGLPEGTHTCTRRREGPGKGKSGSLSFFNIQFPQNVGSIPLHFQGHLKYIFVIDWLYMSSWQAKKRGNWENACLENWMQH